MEKNYWINKNTRDFLSRGYLKEGQTVEERIYEIADHAEAVLLMPGFRDKFLGYMEQGFYSLASPIWANFGAGRGLPISCNGSYVPDSIAGIYTKLGEVAVMTKEGAGTSGYFGALRSRGEKISTGGQTSGAVHFMELYETAVNVTSQGNTRRGSFAAYLPIDHGDIEEFLEIRSEGHPIQNMSIGVCISNQWMEEMIKGDKIKRKIWAKVIAKRFESGYPYIFWSDNVNDNKPQVYKDKNMTIWASNLCVEINLVAEEDESFVCCLSSMNLLHYDIWKDTDAVFTLTLFLDAVMSEYVRLTQGMQYMEAAHKFARRHRALGLGVLGWHSYLQSKMLPFEGWDATMLNAQIFQHLQKESMRASVHLAELFGEPEVLKGYGRRNTTLLAIAPTTSSSFILGQVSPSIEPLNSNYFVKDLAKGKFSYKNPYLMSLLEKKEKNTPDVWERILMNGGSVQELEFLSEEEKEVFKTFGEISQLVIIQQAAQRQKYIDQAQSINLMIHPDTPAKEVNQLMITAWELGVKSLYYQRGTNPAQEMSRNLLRCKSCEG